MFGFLSLLFMSCVCLLGAAEERQPAGEEGKALPTAVGGGGEFSAFSVL